MVTIRIRGAGAGLAGASGILALSQGAMGLGCGGDTNAQSQEEKERSTTSALSETGSQTTAAPGSAALDVGYGFGFGSGPNYELTVRNSTTDEYIRTGEALTLRFPASFLWPLAYPFASYPEAARAKSLRVAVTLHYFRNGAEVATAPIATSSGESWVGDEFFSLMLEAPSFVVPSGADALAFELVLTDVEDATLAATIKVDEVRPVAVLGSDVPNKTWLLDSDGAKLRQRVLEGGSPVRGAALAVAYTDYRANTLVDAASIDREIGTYKAFGRFGTFTAPMYGEIVHDVAVGVDVDDGQGFPSEHPMAASTVSRLAPTGRTFYEARVAAPVGARKLRAYVHVKTYLIVDYTRFSNVLTRKFNQGDRILVREKWDQPGGAGSNYELALEDAINGTSFARTVMFIKGITNAGQSLFIRGGLDEKIAAETLELKCTDAKGRPTYDCAIPFVPRQYRNASTTPWKGFDRFLDWYGREASQTGKGTAGALAEGTAADWTTNVWPSAWGPAKTVARDGYGVEALNVYGAHYWMVDADMDCSQAFRAADGSRWFEVKSFVTGGGGWEGDVRQPGAPYVSGNHFAKCGAVSVFERNVAAARFAALP
jgi:hypothetical protein